MVLDSKTCSSPVKQIFRNYPIFFCLPFFTYLRSMAEALPFY